MNLADLTCEPIIAKKAQDAHNIGVCQYSANQLLQSITPENMATGIQRLFNIGQYNNSFLTSWQDDYNNWNKLSEVITAMVRDNSRYNNKFSYNKDGLSTIGVVHYLSKDQQNRERDAEIDNNPLTDNGTYWSRGIKDSDLLSQRFNLWDVSSDGTTITLTSVSEFSDYLLTNSQVVNGTTISWIADANAPGYSAGQHYTLTIDGNSYNLFANTTGQAGKVQQWKVNEGVEAVYSDNLNGFVIKSGAGGSGNGFTRWSATTNYSSGDVCYVLQNDGVSIITYYSLQDDNYNHIPANTIGTYWQLYQAGYRQLGEIVQSAIPLTDAGLVLAQGTWFSSNGSYKAFYSYLSELAYQEMQTIPASSLHLTFNSIGWGVHGGFDNTIQAGSNYVYIKSSSGSAQGDYFYCRDVINATGSSWEFTFAFAIADTSTNTQAVCGFVPSGSGYSRLAVFVNEDRTLRLSASSSGASSYDVFDENTNLQLSPNIVYRIKISYSSSTGYKAYLGEQFHGTYTGNFQTSPFWSNTITTNVLADDVTLQCGHFGVSANDIVKYCIGTKIACNMWGLDYNNSNHLSPIANSQYNGELFASESVYNGYVSSTGGCSKYIITPRSFRLPMLNGWLKCGASNQTLEAGLPNISDNFTTTDSITGNVKLAGGSSIYGNANDVQPKGAQVYTYICCATTKKAVYEIDIDEVMADISTLGAEVTDLQDKTRIYVMSSGTKTGCSYIQFSNGTVIVAGYYALGQSVNANASVNVTFTLPIALSTTNNAVMVVVPTGNAFPSYVNINSTTTANISFYNPTSSAVNTNMRYIYIGQQTNIIE